MPWGVLVGKWLLPGFVITPSGFPWVVLIFTAARFIPARATSSEIFGVAIRFARPVRHRYVPYEKETHR